VSKRGNVTLVRFGEHRILNEVAIDLIGDELYGVADRPDCCKLLLNFAGVEYLSSLMLGKLVMLKKKIESQGGKLKLCDIGPEIGEVFKTTSLDQVLDIRENEVDALKAFG
jgi:anti-sigma B factor antagonist